MERSARRRKVSWPWQMVILLLLVPMVSQCFRSPNPPGEPVVRGDCQQGAVAAVVVSNDSMPPDSVFISSFPLIGEIANIPEYHDCQRFILPAKDQNAPGQGHRYGPLVAVWAAHRLDTLLIPLPPRGSGIAAAIIYNFDREEYRPLRLRSGFSCLYLMPDQLTTRWQAKIEPMGLSAKDCNLPREWGTINGAELAVTSETLPRGLNPDDLPPVARWGWDQTSGKQYLGIRCGDLWCDLSDGSFIPSITAQMTSFSATNVNSVINPMPTAVSIPQASRREIQRTLAVKGWYDEQILALRDPNTKQLVPSGITGIAFPHPALDRLSKRSVASPTPDLTGTWIPSAYILVSADYPGKVHLFQGLNEIWLCQGSTAECAIPAVPANCSSHDMSWARIVPDPSKGGPQYHCVKRMTHSPDIPAGTVRWRWSELDEQQWVRCPTTGCCTVN